MGQNGSKLVILLKIMCFDCLESSHRLRDSVKTVKMCQNVLKLPLVVKTATSRQKLPIIAKMTILTKVH